jgi:hypothetical protein
MAINSLREIKDDGVRPDRLCTSIISVVDGQRCSGSSLACAEIEFAGTGSRKRMLGGA